MARGRARQTATRGGSWTRKQVETVPITKARALELAGSKRGELLDGKAVIVNSLLTVQGIPNAAGAMRYQQQVFAWVPA